MFERLSDADVREALDDLIGCVGLREVTTATDAVALAERGEIQQCIQLLAARLGLPIRVELLYVSADSAVKGENRFETGAVVPVAGKGEAEWVDRGIAAQVVVPGSLPPFGASRLEGYPIQVRVSEDCRAYPETFVAVMLHELSHVMLASLRHAKADNELYADLLPIVLGFAPAVRQGRKISRRIYRAGQTLLMTSTFGYLTDRHLDFACDYVAAALGRHRTERDALLALAKQLRAKVHASARLFSELKYYLAYLGARRATKMPEGDATVAVQCHSWDYAYQREAAIANGRATADAAEQFLRPLHHYTARALVQMREYRKRIELASGALDSLMASTSEDAAVLRRYVPLGRRIVREVRAWLNLG